MIILTNTEFFLLFCIFAPISFIGIVFIFAIIGALIFPFKRGEDE